jgi:thiol-disulfide isomerase/thioredoxin
MTRTRLRLLAFLGAGVVLVLAGIVIWLNSTSGFRAPSVPASVQTGSTTSDFTPLDKPRPLPELHFTNAEGRDLSISDFRGRLVLLNLWATWCVPCRKEMPTLDRLEAKLGGPDFEVVALSIDRQGLEAVKSFFAELGIKALRIYLDQSGKAAFALNAPGLPTTLLIDRDGHEIARKIGPAEWDSPKAEGVIRRYLTRKAAAAGEPDNLRPNSENALNVNTDSREVSK